jgi:uncharacterized integral membrane protein (TIGR00697 family)
MPLTTRSWYAPLVGLFMCLLVIANISAVKLIGLGEVSLFGSPLPVTIDGGAFLFPLTYILGDVLTEIFGFRAARRAIWLGFVGSVCAAGSFWLVGAVPPADSWEGQAAFETVLGFVPRIVLASMAAYLAGQLLNAATLAAIKRKTGERALAVRLLASTAIGELADTAVFCFIAFYGVISGAQFIGYAALGYIYKCLAEVVLLPVTYRVVALVKRHETAITRTLES